MHISLIRKIWMRWLATTFFQRLTIFSFLLGCLLCVISLVSLFLFFQTRITKDLEENIDRDSIEEETPTSLATTREIQEATISAQLAVSITGAIRKPGIYTFPEKSRVADVIQVAEGLTKDAATEWVDLHVNFAQLLVDEMQIYIPKRNAVEYCIKDSGVASITNLEKSSHEKKINVNNASIQELLSLKGIGDVRAEEIVKNRPYKDLQDFQKRSILSASIVEQLKENISF